jgi:ACS family tartrate transporter-like MFS transporter
MHADIEHAVMRKVAWRLIPFLSLGYLINTLDQTRPGGAAF